MKKGRVNERNTGHCSLEGAAKARRTSKKVINEKDTELMKSILEKVFDSLEYNPALNDVGHLNPGAKYTDGGRFAICLTREQLEQLSDIIHEKL